MSAYKIKQAMIFVAMLLSWAACGCGLYLAMPPGGEISAIIVGILGGLILGAILFGVLVALWAIAGEIANPAPPVDTGRRPCTGSPPSIPSAS